MKHTLFKSVRTGGASCSWFNTIARLKKNVSYALTVNTCIYSSRKYSPQTSYKLDSKCLVAQVSDTYNAYLAEEDEAVERSGGDVSERDAEWPCMEDL